QNEPGEAEVEEETADEDRRDEKFGCVRSFGS
ncbi:hypothetical protein A2U01_0102434, partial [Trifolium medium]|nr:hypothetical protein [Trifolium medium]